MISGFIWNSRGTGDVEKQSYIRKSIEEYKLDFVGIQETVRQNYPADFITKIAGSHDFHWDGVPAKGRSGSILVGINKNTLEVLEKKLVIILLNFLL